jgi:hypothetical protein
VPQGFANAGPWLAGDKPALVFWIGGADLTHERLFKHLRSLNKVLVPQEHGKADELEAVIFRHADGNVLASVLPVLDEARFARLFGPALALTFHAPDFPDEQGWPVRRAVLPLPAANPPPGMLALTQSQLSILDDGRMDTVVQRIVKEVEASSPLSPASGRKIDHSVVREMCSIAYVDMKLEADQHLLDYCLVLWTHGYQVRHNPRFRSICERPGW